VACQRGGLRWHAERTPHLHSLAESWGRGVGSLQPSAVLQCKTGRDGVRMRDRLEVDGAQPYSHNRNKESEVWALARELPFEVAQRVTCSKCPPIACKVPQWH